VTRAELLQFEGVSRSVLEERVRVLVRAADDLEVRLFGRLQMTQHALDVPGANYVSRCEQFARGCAYSTALGDLRELLPVGERAGG